MVDQIETFDLNEHMHDAYNTGDAHLKFGNLFEDSRSHVGSISTPSEPSISESIITSIDLDVKVETTQEVLKIQFILNQKKWVPHHMLFSLGIFLW
jgi:hypothetical protein